MNYDNKFKNIKKAINELDLSDETKKRLNVILHEEIEKEFNNIKICDKTLDEVIAILNGLDMERRLDIKMTMENLTYLFKKALDEQNKWQQMEMKKMRFGDDK